MLRSCAPGAFFVGARNTATRNMPCMKQWKAFVRWFLETTQVGFQNQEFPHQNTWSGFPKSDESAQPVCLKWVCEQRVMALIILLLVAARFGTKSFGSTPKCTVLSHPTTSWGQWRINGFSSLVVAILSRMHIRGDIMLYYHRWVPHVYGSLNLLDHLASSFRSLWYWWRSTFLWHTMEMRSTSETLSPNPPKKMSLGSQRFEHVRATDG